MIKITHIAAISLLTSLALMGSARAQNSEVVSEIVKCAANLSLDFSKADLQGTLNDVFSGDGVNASGQIVLSNYLELFDKKDRLKAIELYHGCINKKSESKIIDIDTIISTATEPENYSAFKILSDNSDGKTKIRLGSVQDDQNFENGMNLFERCGGTNFDNDRVSSLSWKIPMPEKFYTDNGYSRDQFDPESEEFDCSIVSIQLDFKRPRSIPMSSAGAGMQTYSIDRTFTSRSSYYAGRWSFFLEEAE